MKDLSLQTGAHTVHWGENTSCIFIVEAKRVTPIVTHIDIPVYFIHDQFDNGPSSKIREVQCHSGRYV